MEGTFEFRVTEGSVTIDEANLPHGSKKEVKQGEAYFLGEHSSLVSYNDEVPHDQEKVQDL